MVFRKKKIWHTAAEHPEVGALIIEEYCHPCASTHWCLWRYKVDSGAFIPGITIRWAYVDDLVSLSSLVDEAWE